MTTFFEMRCNDDPEFRVLRIVGGVKSPGRPLALDGGMVALNVVKPGLEPESQFAGGPYLIMRPEFWRLLQIGVPQHGELYRTTIDDVPSELLLFNPTLTLDCVDRARSLIKYGYKKATAYVQAIHLLRINPALVVGEVFWVKGSATLVCTGRIKQVFESARVRGITFEDVT